MNTWQATQLIKQLAFDLGFSQCGISKAEPLHQEAEQLEKWLAQGKHGQMDYMANHFDKRIDPTKLVPGTKSVVSLSYNYFTSEKQLDTEAPKLSMYAYGKDYHKVVKKKLKTLFNSLQEQIGQVEGRYFVDSAPVLEKTWAQKSGVGWIGKNSNLLVKQHGSFFFLAELFLDLELDYDGPVKDYCGSCTKCIDACPTDAIYEPYKVDGSKCISHFTIEVKDAQLPKQFKGKFDNWAYGCDICQQVCPINSQAKQHNEPAFEPKPELLQKTKAEWGHLTSENFDNLFEGSAVKRAGYDGLKRNIQFVS